VSDPKQSSIFGIFDEPWYVLVGVVVAVAAMQVVERRLKKAGRWPNKNETPGVDRLIWTAVLMPTAVIVGLGARWLSR
jgi:hypothetical protein